MFDIEFEKKIGINIKMTRNNSKVTHLQGDWQIFIEKAAERC